MLRIAAIGRTAIMTNTETSGSEVTTCLDNAVGCITDGAGTGKTTVLRTALSKLGFEIHAVALGGRAAMHYT